MFLVIILFYGGMNINRLKWKYCAPYFTVHPLVENARHRVCISKSSTLLEYCLCNVLCQGSMRSLMSYPP